MIHIIIPKAGTSIAIAIFNGLCSLAIVLGTETAGGGSFNFILVVNVSNNC